MTVYDFKYRIYYEDTDAGGIVYYANYLKFAERARTDMLRSNGIYQNDLIKQDIAFVVKNINAEYIKPAKLDDLITVTAEITKMTRASMIIEQKIKNADGVLIFTLSVTIVCISLGLMKPRAIPDFIKK